jgi:hypothetical protein
VKFSDRPSILLNNREYSPLGVNEGVNFTPRGQISPLGAWGEHKNGPQDDQIGRILADWVLVYSGQFFWKFNMQPRYLG